MTARQLISLSLSPAAIWIRRLMMGRKLRALYRHRDYFAWQVANGQAGMQDVDKQIVILESDIRGLQ